MDRQIEQNYLQEHAIRFYRSEIEPRNPWGLFSQAAQRLNFLDTDLLFYFRLQIQQIYLVL